MLCDQDESSGWHFAPDTPFAHDWLHEEGGSAESRAPPSASAVTSAVAAASGAPEPSTPTGLVPVAPRKIPPGPAPNGTWTVEFGIERIAGDENLDWSGAVAHCHEKGKELCLETQWQRACELDPKIGELESWTLTADYPGAVVRGGADGCKTRSFQKVAEKNPTRVGLCCDRAVGITSDDKSNEFRAVATKRILEAEAALREVSAESTGKLLGDKVSLEGNEYDRELTLSKLADERKSDPERLSFYDHCRVQLSTDPSPLLIADCGVVQRSQGKTRGFAQRIAFASTTGPVVYLGDPKAMKPKEQKERVRAFLPSE